MPHPSPSVASILGEPDPSLFDIHTHAPGPQGALPITAEMLLNRPSGDLFGLSQNAGMGWDPSKLAGKEFLLLSTHGGIRANDGTPVALGYHTGHWEVNLLMITEPSYSLRTPQAPSTHPAPYLPSNKWKLKSMTTENQRD